MRSARNGDGEGPVRRRWVGRAAALAASTLLGCAALATGADQWTARASAPGAPRARASAPSRRTGVGATPAWAATSAASRTPPTTGSSAHSAAPGGPYLLDRYGRVVLLRGVNVVDKRAPYEVEVTPGRTWSFTAVDAARIAALGFDVVRLGLTWQGLKPGRLGPNDPSVCRRRAPQAPNQWNAAAADAYLAGRCAVINLLERFGIATIVDMHQDAYSALFGGDGAPNWAACTAPQGDEPAAAVPGRYGDPAIAVAFAHFWRNDVVGDLQAAYDQAWSAVATALRGDPGVVGYDPMNEPWSPVMPGVDNREAHVLLACFYSGRAHPAIDLTDRRPVACPTTDPLLGVVPRILAADPSHLVFVEPDLYSQRHQGNMLSPIDEPNLVLNFHDYCSQRAWPSGEPTDTALCADANVVAITSRPSSAVCWPRRSSRRARRGS